MVDGGREGRHGQSWTALEVCGGKFAGHRGEGQLQGELGRCCQKSVGSAGPAFPGWAVPRWVALKWTAVGRGVEPARMLPATCVPRSCQLPGCVPSCVPSLHAPSSWNALLAACCTPPLAFGTDSLPPGVTRSLGSWVPLAGPCEPQFTYLCCMGPAARKPARCSRCVPRTGIPSWSPPDYRVHTWGPCQAGTMSTQHSVGPVTSGTSTHMPAGCAPVPSMDSPPQDLPVCVQGPGAVPCWAGG